MTKEKAQRVVGLISQIVEINCFIFSKEAKGESTFVLKDSKNMLQEKLIEALSDKE